MLDRKNLMFTIIYTLRESDFKYILNRAMHERNMKLESGDYFDGQRPVCVVNDAPSCASVFNLGQDQLNVYYNLFIKKV